MNYSEMSVEELHKQLEFEEKKIAFFDTLQMAKKIQMNSLYGAMANKHFVLFNQELAAAITSVGRVANMIAAYNIDEYHKEHYNEPSMMYGDTDSSYHEFDCVVQKDIPDETDVQKITDYLSQYAEEKIQPIIDDCMTDYSDMMNAFEGPALAMDREIIADSGFNVQKKKYVARVLDSEGVRLAKPKMKVMGLEIVRSSTPQFCRKYLKESIGLILDATESEMQDFIKESRNKFMEADIESISRVSGVSRVDYDLYGGKAVPINSRAAIVHNTMIKKNGLENDYEPIQAKDKLKYVFLRTPNPAMNQNVFGYVDVKILDDLDLYKYIDYNEMFEKFFISPMQIMLDAIGWSSEKQATFDEWF